MSNFRVNSIRLFIIGSNLTMKTQLNCIITNGQKRFISNDLNYFNKLTGFS